MEFADLTTTQQHRFWFSINPRPDGCWAWDGRPNKNGYVQFRARIGGNKTFRDYVHRIIYREMVAQIPEGYEIDHLCRNRWCINPDHLEAVTHVENMRRIPIKQEPPMAKINREKGACVNGHTYTEETVVILKDRKGYSYRGCRECRRNR